MSEMDQPAGLIERFSLPAQFTEGKTFRLELVVKEPPAIRLIDWRTVYVRIGYLTELMDPEKTQAIISKALRCGCSAETTPRYPKHRTEMVVNGWAWVTEQYAFEREAEYFQALGDDAREHKRGLWAADDPEPVWEFCWMKKRHAFESRRDRAVASSFAGAPSSLCPNTPCQYRPPDQNVHPYRPARARALYRFRAQSTKAHFHVNRLNHIMLYAK